MKRLLLVINSLNVGGIEKAVINLLNCLKMDDWQIEIRIVKKEGVFLADIPEEVEVKEIEMPEIIRDMTQLSTSQIIVKYIKQCRFTAVLKTLRLYLRRHGKNMDGNMRVYFNEYEHNVPALKEVYDVAIDYQGQGSFPTYFVAKKVQAKKKLSWIHNDFNVVNDSLEWLRLLYSDYNKIVSVSNKAKISFIMKFPEYADKSDVCYNVVPEGEIKIQSEEYEVAKGDGWNITTVGRLSYQKGYDVALNAMKRLKDRGVAFCYYIVGEGEARKELEEQIKLLKLEKNVFLAGFQKNPYPYMRMCDIYLQPSRFEGFCITLTEAKILGKTIITTDFAGADEQITDGVDGIIVECDDEQIYDAVIRVISEDGLADKLKNNLENMNLGNDSIDKFLELINER
jgi:glycosyltransferase involved in cell wall biosynthesis